MVESTYTSMYWAFAFFVFLAGVGVGVMVSEIFLPRGKTRLNEVRERVQSSRLRETATTLTALADMLDDRQAQPTVPGAGEQ